MKMKLRDTDTKYNLLDNLADNFVNLPGEEAFLNGSKS